MIRISLIQSTFQIEFLCLVNVRFSLIKLQPFIKRYTSDLEANQLIRVTHIKYTFRYILNKREYVIIHLKEQT